MNEYIDQYLAYMVYDKNISMSTGSSYRRDLKNLWLYLSENNILSVKEVQYSHLMAYLDALRNEGKANATVSRSIATYRGFFSYLELSRVIQINPAHKLKAQKKDKIVPEILTIEEVNAFLIQPNDSKLGIRDRAMLELLYATGIRVSELVGLSLSDLNLSLGYLKCSDKVSTRIIPLGKTSCRYLTIYLDKVRLDLIKKNSMVESQKALFLNSNGAILTRQGFWKIIKGYGNSANIDKQITPHMLRHSFGCHLVQNGADLKSVQEMMGHKSIISTQVYSEMNDTRLKDVYKKAHPRP